MPSSNKQNSDGQSYIFYPQIESQQTIGQYLKNEQQFSKKLLMRVKYEGVVLQNQKLRKLQDLVDNAYPLIVTLPKEKRSASFVPIAGEITIVYEDQWYIVVDKPAGLLSIPSHTNNNDSLLQRVLAYCLQQNDTSGSVHIITRLDQATRGLVLIAKSQYAKQQQQGQKIERHYYACVEGIIEQPTGRLAWPIGRGHGVKRKCDPSGKPASTRFRCLSHGKTTSLVAIELETGRTHQIRVHFATFGFPLVGDGLYGEAPTIAPLLQSYYLAFTHPFLKENCSFELPLDQQLQKACR